MLKNILPFHLSTIPSLHQIGSPCQSEGLIFWTLLALQIQQFFWALAADENDKTLSLQINKIFLQSLHDVQIKAI